MHHQAQMCCSARTHVQSDTRERACTHTHTRVSAHKRVHMRIRHSSVRGMVRVAAPGGEGSGRRTGKVDGADCVDMVVHVGGVGAAVPSVLARKLGPRPLQPDPQPVPGPPNHDAVTKGSLLQKLV